MRLLVCLGLSLLFTACGQRPWNVVLVTFDTTRADFIGCYGKETARTPNLDRLAAEGFLFEHAYASNPVTQPSHSTILTGVYPMVHGVRDNTFFHLPEERRTLAELLKERGYRTGAAIGGFPLTREFGTDQGFDFYDDDLQADRLDHRGRPEQRRRNTWYDERPASHVNDAILPWLREGGGEPFFVWLHYWDPHEPHIAPAPYGQMFAHDPYQGEIAYADESLGTILAELRKLGEWDRTLFVMTADHGEGRREHKEMTHAFLAYGTTLHVPLIMRVPDADGGRRVAERVGTVDVVPTVLDLLGFDAPDELQGRSLTSVMDGSTAELRDYYSESLSPRLSHGFGELRVLYRGPFKYIHGPRPELFNVEDDPDERHDLLTGSPDEQEQFEAALRGFLADHASPEAAAATYEASEETKRKLAALGYIDATGEGPQAVTEELASDGVAPQDRVGDINLASRLRRELGSGQFHLAKRTASRLVGLTPDHGYYRAQLAAACLGLRQTEEAARVVDETETFSAANVPVFLQVARALFEDGERERGLAMGRRLVEAEGTAEGHVALGRMLRQAGDFSALEEHIAKALELDPKSRVARLELARHLVDVESFERAENELRLLFEDFPIDVEGHLSYARLLRESGRTGEALASAERALRLAPRSCEAHLERLTVLVELGESERAEEASQTLRQQCREDETRARATELMENA